MRDEINSEETAKIINRGKTTAVKMLNKLADMNLIVWTGISRFDNKGKYIIKNQFRSVPFNSVQFRSVLFITIE